MKSETREKFLLEEKQFQQKSLSDRIELVKTRSGEILLKTKIKFVGVKLNGSQIDLMGFVTKKGRKRFILMYHNNTYSKSAIQHLPVLEDVLFNHPLLKTYSEVNDKIIFCVALSRVSTNINRH